SHSFDVAQEESFVDETRKCSLVNRRRVLVHCAANFDQRIDYLLWRDEVTQPQGRKQNFAHRSGVNDPTEIVDPLQAGKRQTGKAELRVKVVFKNKCIVSTRKIEQCGPAFETHRHPERVLMRRCYVDEFWLL